MENKRDHRSGNEWEDPGPHGRFLELCAISTSGDLTDEERKDLQAHLAECPDCRQASKEFEAAAEIGVPLLHSQLSGRDSLDQDPVPAETAKAVSCPALKHAETARGQRESLEQNDTIAFAHRNRQRPRLVNWNYVWMP